MNAWDEQIVGLNSLLNTDKAMRAALSSLLAVQKKRIFSGGQDAQQSQIGTYSTKPASISKKQQAVNTGKTYFKGGYSEYKTAIGKNPGYVNLRNTDQMMFDYSVVVVSESRYGLGFSNETNFDKSNWMEEKYKKDIFDESQEEGKVITTVLNAYLERTL